MSEVKWNRKWEETWQGNRKRGERELGSKLGCRGKGRAWELEKNVLLAGREEKKEGEKENGREGVGSGKVIRKDVGRDTGGEDEKKK